MYTRTSESAEQDYRNLIRLLSFIVNTRDDAPSLEFDERKTLTWHADTYFAVHADMRIHAGSSSR